MGFLSSLKESIAMASSQYRILHMINIKLYQKCLNKKMHFKITKWGNFFVWRYSPNSFLDLYLRRLWPYTMQYHLLVSSLCLPLECFNADDTSLSFHFTRNYVYSWVWVQIKKTEAAIISLQAFIERDRNLQFLRKWAGLACLQLT